VLRFLSFAENERSIYSDKNGCKDIMRTSCLYLSDWSI
jgi:hypothetical protein